MLRSMTAYGRHSVSTESGEFTWELRSVNNRYLETTLRLPEDVRALEPKVRDAIARVSVAAKSMLGCAKRQWCLNGYRAQCR